MLNHVILAMGVSIFVPAGTGDDVDLESRYSMTYEWVYENSLEVAQRLSGREEPAEFEPRVLDRTDPLDGVNVPGQRMFVWCEVGDTVELVAWKANCDVEKLCLLNDIQPGHVFTQTTVLCIQQSHLVLPDESLEALASLYQARPSTIARLNGFDEDDDLEPWTRIEVPSEMARKSTSYTHVNDGEPIARTMWQVRHLMPMVEIYDPDISPFEYESMIMEQHQLQRGETLEEVAELYDLTEQQLRIMNGLREGQRVSAGRNLAVMIEMPTRESASVEDIVLAIEAMGTSIEDFVILNDYDTPEDIWPGELVIMPVGGFIRVPSAPNRVGGLNAGAFQALAPQAAAARLRAVEMAQGELFAAIEPAEVEVVEAPLEQRTPFPRRAIPEDHPEIFREVFDIWVDVFGVTIYAAESTGMEKIDHAAEVLAEFLDNDEDGEIDNELVHQAMVDNNATLILFGSEDEFESSGIHESDIPEERILQGLWGDEIHPGGAAQGVFDATLEEVLHLVTHAGYAFAYPDVFGERPGTALADAMDLARGGHFEKVPAAYPEDAWYTYDDETCEYGCQIAEYLYWAVTSVLGGQDFPGRLEEIEHEWRLNTAEKIRERDPAVYELITDPEYRFATRLPDGNYSPN